MSVLWPIVYTMDSFISYKAVQIHFNPLSGMEEFVVVEKYLRCGRYPDGLSKEEKVNLRGKCHTNFLFKGRLLKARGVDESESCDSSTPS